MPPVPSTMGNRSKTRVRTSFLSSLLLLFSSIWISSYSWFTDASSSSFFTCEEKVTPDSLAWEKPASSLSCFFMMLNYFFTLPKTADRDYSDESIDDLRDALSDGFDNEDRKSNEVLTLGCKFFWILWLAWLSSWQTRLLTALFSSFYTFRF